MYQSIGEVFLQTILKATADPSPQTIHEKNTVNLPYPIATTTHTRLRPVEIRGYLFNNTNKTRKEYINDLNALQGRSAAYNRIKMEGLDGYLVTGLPEIRDTQDYMNTYILTGLIHPTNEYITYYQYRVRCMENTLSRVLPSYFVLPYGVGSMELSDRFGESLTYSKLCDIVTPDGNLPVFKMPDWFTVDNATYMADVISTDNSARYQAIQFNDVMEYASWTFVPGYDWYAGANVFSVDCKISNSDGEILNVMIQDELGDIVFQRSYPLDNTEYEKIVTDPMTLQKYKTYTVTLTKSFDQVLLQYNFAAYNIGLIGHGNIDIDNVRMSQVNTPNFIRFTTPAPNMNKGECKVYDTVTTGNVTKSTWKRIYSAADHTFTGHIVFENATMQWRINPTALWSATGIFTDRISSATGTLYPADFGSVEVNMGIADIKPDEIVVIFKLRSTGKLCHVCCTITPLSMHFKVTPLVSFASASGWKLDITNNVSKGILDSTIQSMVMFTATSSVTMIKSKIVTPTYSTNGIYSNDGVNAETLHTFVISVLPRTSYNVGKLYHNKNVTGADYYVDGEYIDTTKLVYLSDFIKGIYESGLMVNMNISHKLYGDELWT